MDVPATVAIAAAAFAFPDSEWLEPALIANSAVGFVYMFAEERALRDPGTKAFGRRWPLHSVFWNVVVNVVMHAIVPFALLRSRARGKKTSAGFLAKVVSLQALGIACIDLEKVYPTSRRPVLEYVVSHCVVVAIAAALQIRNGGDAAGSR